MPGPSQFSLLLEPDSRAERVLGMAEIPREEFGGDGRIRTAE